MQKMSNRLAARVASIQSRVTTNRRPKAGRDVQDLSTRLSRARSAIQRSRPHRPKDW